MMQDNSMTLIYEEKTDYDLVFCGGYKDEAIFNEMVLFIEQNNLKNRVKLFIRIPTANRNWLLKNAKLFVTPSLYEGFGRTPVEAAMCRVSVISTKETSLFDATMGLVNYVENAKDENIISRKSGQKIQKIANLQYYKSKANYGTKKKGISR